MLMMNQLLNKKKGVTYGSSQISSMDLLSLIP